MLKIVLPPLILCVLSISIAAQQPTEVLGSIENGVYKNSFLRFELTYPSGWLVSETEERKAAIQIGSEAIKTGNKKADALLADSAKKELVLFLISEKPLGSSDNGAFGMSVTKLPAKGYTPKMLTETFKSTFLASTKNRLVKDISIHTIGGRSWGNVLIDLDIFGKAIHTNYFVTVIGEYALVATMSYQDEKHLEKMEAAFRTIKFSKE